MSQEGAWKRHEFFILCSIWAMTIPPLLDSAGVVKDFATSSCWLLALSHNYYHTAGYKQRVFLQTAANIPI